MCILKVCVAYGYGFKIDIDISLTTYGGFLELRCLVVDHVPCPTYVIEW